MKNSIITLLFFLLIISGFPQNSRFEYAGRFTPSINKSNLAEANFINEIMPQFGSFFMLSFSERAEFEKQRITVFPQKYFYPQESYNHIMSYVSVEITATCNGIVLTSASTSDTLTYDQKIILNTADLGTDFRIKIKFYFKNQANENLVGSKRIVEGEYLATVVPETEAEFPGGFRQLTEYLNENVFNKLAEKSNAEKLQQAVGNFTVNEDGQIVDARILKTSTDPKIDELLLDVTNKMPKWIPAENSMGLKVKQEFNIPLGGSGGC